MPYTSLLFLNASKGKRMGAKDTKNFDIITRPNVLPAVPGR